MKVLIAGGGIGGIAVALALAKNGHAVTVFEQASAIGEIGAGVQISPNGMKVLDWLGVIDALRDTLFEPEAIELRHGRSGRQIFSLPMKGYASKRWGARFIQIHRADLHSALLDALECIAPGSVHTGSRLSSYEDNGSSVSITLDNGEIHAGDLLIGADGLHSVVRAQMIGPDAPRFTGNIAWRTLVPAAALGKNVPPRGGCIWAGDRRHAVTTRVRGGDLVNFVGVIEKDEPAEEGWDVTGAREAALRDFGGWNSTLDAILNHAEILNRWALYDRAPLPRWHEGCTVLLGDAAHPMLPSMAQGAVQALEDAYVLADCLKSHTNTERALAAYYHARIDRTAKIQARSAQNVRLFHKGGPFSKLAFYGPLSVAGRMLPEILHRQNDWIYGGGPLGDL